MKLDYAANNFAALDRFGRVLDQFWSDYGANPDPDHFTYTYDRAGNRLTKTNALHTAFNETYTYDDLDRLETMDRADSFDQDWTLDGLDNFSTFNDDGTSQNRTTNAANEITGLTGSWVDPTYDAAGNMMSGPKTGDEDTPIHYVYDAWNRQVGVYADNSGEPGDLIAEYEYDGANRRLRKTLADDTSAEYYYNQQWQLLEEKSFDDEGTPTAVDQYVWSPQYVDAPVVRFHDGNVDGDCNSATDALDTIRYYTWDANHNVTTTITIGYSSTVTQHYVYSAYGETTVYDDAWVNPAAPAEDGPLYCGYFFDAETRNDLARNRYYTVALATWTSRDPIGYRGGMNLYEYCGDDPLGMTDPMGLLTRRLGTKDRRGNAIAAYNVYWTQFTLSAKPRCRAVIIQHVIVSGSNNLNRNFGTVDYYEWLGPTIIQPAVTRTNLTDHWSYRGDKQFPTGHSQITTETVIQHGKATAYEYTEALKAILDSWGKFPAYPFGNTTWSSGSYPASKTFNAAGAKVLEEEDMEHVVKATWDVTRTGNKTTLDIDK